MIEAFKIGITVAVANNASSVLSIIARDFAKTEASAIRLKTAMREIKLLAASGMLIGGAGFLGLAAMKGPLEAAERYENMLTRFKAMNLGDAVNADADRFARGANMIGVSATDLIGTLRDLHNVMGNYEHAKALTPLISQMAYANTAVFGEEGRNRMTPEKIGDLGRVLEQRGGFKSPEEMKLQAEMMQRVITGTGGQVGPDKYLGMLSTGGVAAQMLSNKAFYYEMEPLIQEMKSGTRVGNGLMSLSQNLKYGHSTTSAARELNRLGLLDPKKTDFDNLGRVLRFHPGALKGGDILEKDPMEWMNTVMLPAFKKAGITTDEGIVNEIAFTIGNRVASSLVTKMYLQRDKITKNMNIDAGAMGIDDLLKAARKTPAGAWLALSKSWENLQTAIGRSLIPIIVPGINTLSDTLNNFAVFLEKHPRLAAALTDGFTALALSMAFTGTVLTLTAAIKGFALAMEMLGGGAILKLFSKGAVVAEAGAVAEGTVAAGGAGASALVGAPLAVAVGTGVAAYVAAKERNDFNDKLGAELMKRSKDMAKTGPFGTWGDAAGDWLKGLVTGGHQSGASSTPTTGADVDGLLHKSAYTVGGGDSMGGRPVYLVCDGRVIAQVVEKYLAGGGPDHGTSGFDGRMSYRPSSMPSSA